MRTKLYPFLMRFPADMRERLEAATEYLTDKRGHEITSTDFILEAVESKLNGVERRMEGAR